VIKGKSGRPSSHVLLLCLACALPAASGAEKPSPEAPPPSASQQLLIEIHGLTGVGWWSPAAPEIESPAPAADAAQRLPADA
jgi:hypothetical protein